MRNFCNIIMYCCMTLIGNNFFTFKFNVIGTNPVNLEEIITFDRMVEQVIILQKDVVTNEKLYLGIMTNCEIVNKIIIVIILLLLAFFIHRYIKYKKK